MFTVCDRCFLQISLGCLGWTFDKKAKAVSNSFTEIVNESKHKPSKLWLWANQGR